MKLIFISNNVVDVSHTRSLWRIAIHQSCAVTSASPKFVERAIWASFDFRVDALAMPGAAASCRISAMVTFFFARTLLIESRGPLTCAAQHTSAGIERNRARASPQAAGAAGSPQNQRARPRTRAHAHAAAAAAGCHASTTRGIASGRPAARCPERRRRAAATARARAAAQVAVRVARRLPTRRHEEVVRLEVSHASGASTLTCATGQGQRS